MKSKKRISYKDYSELVPAIAMYRKNLMEACDICTGRDYSTIYTEKRVAGARSKFWLSNLSGRQVASIKRYVKEYPQVYVFAGKRVFKEYTVDFILKPVTHNAYGRPTQPDYQLVFSVK